MKGTVVIQLADSTRFEADILVSEMDILQMQVGSTAIVSVDAMSDLSLPATVTHISPTATIQSGIVNYKVRVEIQSLEAIAEQRQEARQQIISGLAEGEIPPFLQQAIGEGRLTQEQVDEMLKNGLPEDFSPPEGFSFPGGGNFPGANGSSGDSSGQGQLPSDNLTNFQLRQGLTVTVSIILAESTDVLIVPNGAVSQEGSQNYVQVVSDDGQTEKRAVTTGLSDWQNTEIIDGLSEGEQVIVSGSSSTTSSSSSQQSQSGGLGIFGPGLNR